MIVFRPDTSFPFLALSRSAGISYERVLEVSDMVIRRYMVTHPDFAMLAKFTDLPRPIVEAIFYTTKNEHDRRLA